MVDYPQYLPILDKIFMKYSRIGMRLESINDFDFYKKRFLNMHAFLSFCQDYEVKNFNEQLKDTLSSESLSPDFDVKFAKCEQRHMKI